MALESEVAIRSGTTADWAGSTLVLGAGEIGINTTTGEMREGDGVGLWSTLATIGGRSGRATLVAGSKVVADTSVTANSVINLTAQQLGTVGTPQALAVTARVAGTSFTITSAGGTDTSVVGYTIYEP